MKEEEGGRNEEEGGGGEEDGQRKEEEGEMINEEDERVEKEGGMDDGRKKEEGEEEERKKEENEEKIDGKEEEKEVQDFHIKEVETTIKEEKTIDHNKEKLIQNNEINKQSEINPNPQTFLARLNFPPSPSLPLPSTLSLPQPTIQNLSSSLPSLLLPPPYLLPPPSSFLLEKLSDNPSFIIPTTLQFQEIPFFLLDTRLDLYLRRVFFEATKCFVKETGKVDYLEYERRARKRQEKAEREFWKAWKGGFDTPVFEYDME